MESVVKALESGGDWVFITLKTPHGPSKTLEKLVELVEKAGWKATFRANWWTADIPYGLVRIDLKRGKREKIILGRWILGKEWKILRVETMEREKGAEEFFRLVEGITSTLIHDPVIRTMREQY